MLVLPAWFFLGGVLIALVTLALGGVLPRRWLATVVGFEPSTARTMLATGAGSVLSVAAFTFWMRMVVVQLVTDAFSPRLLAQFLDDDFQRRVMAAMIGAFGYVVTVLRAVPSDGGAAAVPQLAVLLAVLAVALAAAGILVSIRVSVHTLDTGRLVRRIADSIVEVIDTVYPDTDQLLPVDPARPAGTPVPVTSAATGWITSIDDVTLLDRLPVDTVVEFRRRVGSFVVNGEVVADAWPADLPDAAVAAIRDAVTVDVTRSPLQDLQYGLRQLVDVGEQSLTPTAPDSGTANEVIGHLGGVLDRLLACPEPPPAHGDRDGRRILRHEELGQAALFRGALAPLRQAGAAFPHVAKDLLVMLAGLRRRAVERQAFHQVAAIDREAALVVDGAMAAGAVLEADALEVRAAAEAFGLPTGVDELREDAVVIPAVT